MPQLEIDVQKSEGLTAQYTCMTLRGFVDSSTLPQFEDKLTDLEETDTRDLLIDCKELHYINSRGMGTIMSFYGDFMEQNREIVLANVSEEVRHLMEVIGVPAIVPLFDDVESATDYLGSGPARKRVHVHKERPKAEVKRMEKTAGSAKGDSLILLITPWVNEFNDIVEHRLAPSVGKFQVVAKCEEALSIFDSTSPDLVILEDKTEGAEDFVFAVKTEKGKSVTPLIRIFGREDEQKVRKSAFKVWENDYLIEPFDLKELFTISEWELNQSPANRPGILCQTHFTLNSSQESVDKANTLGSTIIEQLDFDAVAASGVKAAFAEGLDNAVRHGSSHREESFIDVRFLADKDKVVIRVEDEGPGFDFRYYLDRIAKGPDAYNRELRRTGKRGGLGILLMSVSTDELKYEGRGNIVQLTKNL